ncbi:hypothetical protein KR009_009274, partial [Drosophila setifemur]
MPETLTKMLSSPCSGLDRVDEADAIAAANRLVTRSRTTSRPRHQHQQRHHHRHRHRHPQPSNHHRHPPNQGHSNATGLTANQEVKLKTGDMRMAQMQISLSHLRTEMEQSEKLLRNLAKAVRVNVNVD